MLLFKPLFEKWKNDPNPFVKLTNGKTYSRGFLYDSVLTLSKEVKHSGFKIGLSFNYPINWIIGYLFCEYSGSIAVPVPNEFTEVQKSKIQSYLNFVFEDSAEGKIQIIRAGMPQQIDLPKDTNCVIHTSGSTNDPKGVVLTNENLSAVLESMLSRLQSLEEIHYASILPFSLLLETILGIYLPFYSNGSVTILPQETSPYIGVQNDLSPYLETIRSSHSNFAMVPPSFLYALRAQSEHPRKDLGDSIRVLAVGGAPVSLDCLQYFAEAEIPVFQGYGLSENSSVVSWTYPKTMEQGSVGTLLPHNELRISSEGVVEISGKSLFAGYIQNGTFNERNEKWFSTGDLGHVNENGNLFITGRKANLIVLSSGRNVSPEWIENKFKKLPEVKDVVVSGHGEGKIKVTILSENSNLEGVRKKIESSMESILKELPPFVQISELEVLAFENHHYAVSARIRRTQLLNGASRS